MHPELFLLGCHRTHHRQRQTTELGRLVVCLDYQPSHLGRYLSIQRYCFAMNLQTLLGKHLEDFQRHCLRIHHHLGQPTESCHNGMHLHLVKRSKAHQHQRYHPHLDQDSRFGQRLNFRLALGNHRDLNQLDYLQIHRYQNQPTG